MNLLKSLICSILGFAPFWILYSHLVEVDLTSWEFWATLGCLTWLILLSGLADSYRKSK